MRLFGRELTVTLKKLLPSSGNGFRSWWPSGVREPYPGAWQRNEPIALDTALSYYAVYACVTLISNDIGSLRPKLVALTSDGIWQETTSAAFSPVLKKPNRYQNHIQFKQFWIMSKLTTGNTYVLKERDQRGVVVAQYVLNPSLVTPVVTPDGGVYYQLKADNLNGINQDVTVPASEIIHDRMNCLFHPICGVSPLYSSGRAASLGINIENDSSVFFANGARPGGVLTAPGAISQETADEVKTYWETNFTGANAGRVAVFGDGLQYVQMKSSAADAQLVDQLKLSAEMVCSTFHVPPFKIGVGQIPAGQKVEALNLIYYNDALRVLMEEMEACQDEGLSLPTSYGVELETEGLLRMDSETQIETLGAAVGKMLMKPNEARRKLNLPPVEGGDAVYSQQQNYNLAALAKRDAKDDPFATGTTEAAPAQPVDDTAKALLMLESKQMVAA